MVEAGVPADVFCPVYGTGEVGASLASQALDGLFFTGSEATGRKIASSVYSNASLDTRFHSARGGRSSMFPRLQLELGGKDPAYVRSDVGSSVVRSAL